MFLSMPLFHREGQTNFRLGEILGYASIIVALSMVFFGVRRYRDHYLEGRISFGRAFQTGLLIALVASIVYVLAWVLNVAYGSGEEIMNQYFTYTMDQIRQSGKPAEEIEAEIARIKAFQESYRHPAVWIGMTFLEIFPIGVFVALISAFLLRARGSDSGQPARNRT
jgi:hypothetical protein